MEQAALWYEERRSGLGLEFVAAVDRVMGALTESPLRFPTWTGVWRRAVVRRFPFVVFFEVEADRVVVLAVAHARRKPGYWIARRSPEK
jgi:plasmid stabilization system protein ParE